MKKFKLLFAAVSVFAFAGCDVVENPIIPNTGPLEPKSQIYRNVLIEDFTGHKCNNCPLAADEIHDIKELPFGNQVYAVGIHVTTFFAGPDANYPEDFRTTIGDEYETFFGIQGLPTGMVSRKDYTVGGSSYLKSYSEWSSIASDITKDSATFSINPTINYNSTTRKVNINADITVKKDTTIGNMNFMVMLVEDSIVAPQKMPNGQKNPTYVHNHVLRSSADGDGAFGKELITSGPVFNGQVLTYNGSVELDSTWNKSNCNVLMFVFDKDNQEIWQVTEEHVN